MTKNMNKDTIFADSHCHSDDDNQAFRQTQPSDNKKTIDFIRNEK